MNTRERTDPNLTVEVSLLSGITKMYGIVLAAGNGKRMQEFINRHYDCLHPKQFVAFTGERSMVQHTLRRAEKLISREKLLVVVDPKHQEVIQEQLADRPAGTLIFQPINRETAPGVLLPLSHIYNTDPDSTVAIFPSDHFILEEDRFMEHIRFAGRVVQMFPEQIVLLGIQPYAPEGEYGWIQPGERVLSLNGMEACQVEGFHEKPGPISARRFFKKGYLWNTLVMVTRCSTLWQLAKKALPHIHQRFEKILRAIGKPEEEKTILQEYQEMDQANISHSLLEKLPSHLLVINVRDVFWSDWGNGPRVLKTLKKIGRSTNIREEVSKEEKMILN